MRDSKGMNQGGICVPGEVLCVKDNKEASVTGLQRKKSIKVKKLGMGQMKKGFERFDLRNNRELLEFIEWGGERCCNHTFSL